MLQPDRDVTIRRTMKDPLIRLGPPPSDISSQLKSSPNLRAIEGHYFDLLHLLQADKKQWAIGPFNPVDIFQKPDQQRHECLKWLDNQASSSVIYVSFGTTTCLSDEQIHAIALGLENSGQKFIWVLRDADKGNIFTGDVRKSELPIGYEDRLLEAGQGPRNAMLITKILKLGIVVKDWTPHKDLVESLHIENAVKKLIASKEGDEMRERAAELRNDIKKSVAEGGLSTTSTPDKHGACQMSLGYSGGGPPLDTCAQPAATPLPRTRSRNADDGAARSPELSFGARRRGLHPWVSVPLDSSPSANS
ncbi:hypothetical protein AgCh_004866 [Apium graveolens]